MSNSSDRDNGKAPGQAANGGERDGAKAAYDAKQAKDVKASVEKCNADTERAHIMESIRAERQNAANAKTDGEDYDYYNGLSH
jgi:hypothetical protein